MIIHQRREVQPRRRGGEQQGDRPGRERWPRRHEEWGDREK